MTNDSPLRAVAKPQDPIGLERGLQEPLYPEAGWTGFALYISPCAIRASNDPFTDEEIDAMEECARDFYGGCIEDIADLNTTGLFQMSTTFDYDLHYQTGANFNTTLAALEASMLEHLASMVGLSSCPQERVRELQFFESEISRFEGVSSLPLDRKDPHWGKHIAFLFWLASLVMLLTQFVSDDRFMCCLGREPNSDGINL
jgi:hypothetical protein